MDQSVRLMEANEGYGGSSFTARQRKRMVVCNHGGPHLKAVEFSHTDERSENIRFEVVLLSRSQGSYRVEAPWSVGPS